MLRVPSYNRWLLLLSSFPYAEQHLDQMVTGGSQFAVSANGEKQLFKSGGGWKVVSTAKPPLLNEGAVSMTLLAEINRLEEWKQIFNEAWKYQRDYFYDRNMHGRDWQEVWKEYPPLVSHVRHRADLTYLLDMLGGESGSPSFSLMQTLSCVCL